MSTVLIIGAKSDIAQAVARQYASNGYDLCLAARQADELEAFANDLNVRTLRKVSCVDLDILDFESHQSFYNGLNEKPIGVICAVGMLGDQKIAQSDFQHTHKILDTNFTGIVSLLNIIANDFEERKAGFIVGLSSVAGDRGRASNYIYGSAKAAFSAYLSGLRNRLVSSNVHVMTVKPGFVNTQMTKGMDLPAKLTAEPEDIAKDIYKAQQKGKNTLYSKWMWLWIMLIIKHIPESIFKKLSL